VSKALLVTKEGFGKHVWQLMDGELLRILRNCQYHHVFVEIAFDICCSLYRREHICRRSRSSESFHSGLLSWNIPSTLVSVYNLGSYHICRHKHDHALFSHNLPVQAGRILLEQRPAWKMHRYQRVGICK
jgi:hypothetical protein